MLAEVSGMVPERQAVPTRRALEKAVRLILQAQVVPKPENQRGGWRYAPQSADSDLSVTAWQLLALRAAKDIGCDVPAENIEMAVGYVKRCCGRDGRGFGYQPGQGSTLVLSGTGLLALQVCGEEDSAEVHRTAAFLDDRHVQTRRRQLEKRPPAAVQRTLVASVPRRQLGVGQPQRKPMGPHLLHVHVRPGPVGRIRIPADLPTVNLKCGDSSLFAPIRDHVPFFLLAARRKPSGSFNHAGPVREAACMNRRNRWACAD
jgi:hypothetical protein